MAIYKIKAEDKAALLNRLEKLNVNINSNDLKNKSVFQDGVIVNYFELVIDNPEQEEKINSILNQSPAINQISEMETKKKKLTKDELKEMVRQELQAVIAEKKKVKDEDKKDQLDEQLDEMIDPSVVADVLGVLAGMGGIAASAVALDKWQEKIKMKNPDLYKKMQDLGTTIKRAKGIVDEGEQLEEINGIPVEMIPDFLTNFNGSAEAIGLAKTLTGLAAAGMMVPGLQALISKAKTKFPTAFDKAEEAPANPAQQGEMNEMIDPSMVADVLGVLAGMGGIAASAVALDKWQEKIRAKNPELYKKMQDLGTTIKRAKGIQD
jgi:hypothetical protein